jgi:hypothetical protein
MRVGIDKIVGGLVVIGLFAACAGKSQSGDPRATAGNSGSGVAAGAGSDVGAAGNDDGLGGEAGAATGSGGSAGEDQNPGSSGSSGSAGSSGTGGTILYPPVDIGPQKTSTKLDVLFVVDSSATMADKQNILKLSLPSFVKRLVNPLCVDAQGKPVAIQPASGEAACSSGTRELTPVKDLHLGVITTSLGGHGGTVCASASADEYLDDRAELLPAQRPDLPSYDDAGYLSYDSEGLAGVSDVDSVIADLQTIVDSAGEHGCGYEAPLEAMYRFLVDPEPPMSVTVVNNLSSRTGINQALLAQRKAFLRPDSAVAIVILTDENDCSILDEGQGWIVGTNSRLPRATAACDVNGNDPCCRSCAVRETTPPKGCQSLTDDVVCKAVPGGQSYVAWDTLHDSLNLRCFEQRKRFGFDLLYPVERYSDALSNPQVRNRSGALVDNPLLAARDGKAPRSATLVSVSTIVGAPWQDLATTASLGASQTLEYLDGAGLASNDRWSLLVGDPAKNLPPTDPFMIESPYERTGKNPLTNAAIVASSSMNPRANEIYGHEHNIPALDDLQYACTFPLLAPRACANGDSACDCSASKNGDFSSVVTNNSPLCQPPAGGAATTTQYFGKGYPSTRVLRFAQLLGARAAPASICPKTLAETSGLDFAYNPAFSALIGRIGVTLQ